MDNPTLVFGALFVLAIVVIAAFWAIQRGKSGFKGTIKVPGVEGNIETTKDAPLAGPVQNLFVGEDNSQESVKEAVSKQTQIGGRKNKQTIK